MPGSFFSMSTVRAYKLYQTRGQRFDTVGTARSSAPQRTESGLRVRSWFRPRNTVWC